MDAVGRVPWALKAPLGSSCRFLRACFRSLHSCSLYPALKECISKQHLAKGRVLHALLTEHGLETETFWGSHLVRMYAACERMQEVEAVFGSLPEKNVFTWSITILAHARAGGADRSMELYHSMRSSHARPNQCAYVAIIKACAAAGSSRRGMLIHSSIVEDGLAEDPHITSSLIGMYGRCGQIAEAESALELSPPSKQNLVMWNSMLAACAQHGCWSRAIQIYSRFMRGEGMRADRITYLNLIKAGSASSSDACLCTKRELHGAIVEARLDSDAFVGSSLVGMYCRCRSHRIEDAWAVFHALPSRTVVTWNAMMGGLSSHHGFSQEVFQLFQQLKGTGIQPDSDTYTSVVKASASDASSLHQGRFVHAVLDWTEWGSDPFIASALIEMYSMAGAIDAAHRLLDESPARTIAVWNALMSAYIRHGDVPKMLGIFRQMLLECVEPDRVTFLNVFEACSELGTGNLLHSLALQRGSMKDSFVASALIEMYCRLGYPEYGYRAFELLPLRNSVTWNAMISGFAENGDVRMAFRVFGEMYGDGIEPDNVAYSSILKACFGATFAGRGRLIHSLLACSSACEREQIVGHSLIRVYGGAGSLEDANRVFESLSEKGVVSCNSMISACARCGDYPRALGCFLWMIARGIEPDELTFVCLLSACSHAIRIEEACDHIHSMLETHGIRPSGAHLYCLADLVARTGGLKEAEAILHTIPVVEHLDAGCLSLLGHSGTYGHFDQARRFFTWAQGFEVQGSVAGSMMASND